MATNIEEANKPTLNIDTTLNEPVPMDLSAIKASVDSITQNVAKFLEEQKQATTSATTSATKTSSQPAEKKNWWEGINSPADATALKNQGQPAKTETDYMTEFQNMQNAFYASKGITQETFTKMNDSAAKISSLNLQLQQLESMEAEQMMRIQESNPWALGSSVRGQQAIMQRQLAVQKSGLAYQIAAESIQYNLLKGDVESADKFFTQALDFATYKETQDKQDWEWAMNYYQDADKASKDYIQQQFENARAIEADKRAQKSLELDYIREGRIGGAASATATDWTDLQIKTAIDGIVTSNPDATYDEILQEINSDQTIANKDRAIQIAKDRFGVKDTSNQIAPTVSNQGAASFGKKVKQTSAYLQTLGGRPEIIGGSIVKSAQAVGSFFSGLFGG